MTLSIDDTITVVEVGAMLLGIAITWAVYYGSDKAELPGEAQIPNPEVAADIHDMSEGRTLR